MKMAKFLALVVSIACIVYGCASIVSKSEYPVSISSEPQCAEISITNSKGETVFTGKTPTTITLKAGSAYFKGETYKVSFKQQGYTPYCAQIERGVDGWYVAGNLFFGGLIGWLIVDPLTGAMWKLENLHVYLDAQASSFQSEGLHVVSLDDVPSHLHSKLVKLN